MAAQRAPIPEVFVLNSEARGSTRDAQLGRFVVGALADLGMTVRHLSMEFFTSKRKALEEALQLSQYYIVIFSRQFKNDPTAVKVLNSLFDKFVGKGQKTVLPIRLDVPAREMRKIFPLFATLRERSVEVSSDFEVEAKRLARDMYDLLKSRRESLPRSSLKWHWNDEPTIIEIERLNCFYPIRNIQTVSQSGQFCEDMLVVMPVNSTQELFPGDLVVSINGVPIEQIDKSFRGLKQIPGEIGKPLKVTVRRVVSKPQYVTWTVNGHLEVEGPDRPDINDRVSVFVACSDENEDDKEWSVRLACALTDLGFETELVCVATFETFLHKLNEALKTTHYIPVFSPSGFFEPHCLVNADQLDTMYHQYLCNEKMVLPVARGGLTWDELRGKYSSFCQRPREISANEDIAESAITTARIFYSRLERDGGVQMPDSSMEWEWTSTTESIVWKQIVPLTQIQIAIGGELSTVFVIGQPGIRSVFPGNLGDKLIAVNGHEITGSTSSGELLEYLEDRAGAMNLTLCQCCRKPRYWEEPLLPWKQSQSLQLQPANLESPPPHDAKDNAVRSAGERVNTMPRLEGAHCVSDHSREEPVGQEEMIRETQTDKKLDDLPVTEKPPDVCQESESQELLSPEKGELPDLVQSSLQQQNSSPPEYEFDDLWSKIEEVECEKADHGLGLVINDIKDSVSGKVALFLSDVKKCTTTTGTLAVGDRLLSVGGHDLRQQDCSAARDVIKKLKAGLVKVCVQRTLHPDCWLDAALVTLPQADSVVDDELKASASPKAKGKLSEDEDSSSKASGRSESSSKTMHEQRNDTAAHPVIGAESSVPPVKSATEGAEHNADEVSLPTTPAVAQPAAQSLRQESSEVATAHGGLSSQRPTTARDLLRPHWVELGARLLVDMVSHRLYAQRIVSAEELETIQSGSTRQRKAYQLLMILNTRPWEDIVRFAQLLLKDSSCRDLGQKILSDAGVASDEFVDVQSLLQEKQRLQREKDQLVAELEKLRLHSVNTSQKKE